MPPVRWYVSGLMWKTKRQWEGALFQNTNNPTALLILTLKNSGASFPLALGFSISNNPQETLWSGFSLIDIRVI